MIEDDVEDEDDLFGVTSEPRTICQLRANTRSFCTANHSGEA